MNKDFDNYCKYNGIKRGHTFPYTPQQNGVAKRKNRTLMEMARCMLHARNMDSNFWDEDVHVASYIMNRSPTVGFLPLQASLRVLCLTTIVGDLLII